MGEGSKTQTQILRMPEAFRARGGRREAVLVVVQGEEIGRRHPLRAERVVLGRDPQRADLVLSDPSVSGRHALLQSDPGAGRYVIRDLGSRNGTFVNGGPVDAAVLQDGDKIFAGGTVLKFTFHDSIEDRFHGELERLMHLDSLTGLYVRRWFDREYPRAFDRAREQGRSLCVAMLDLDGLKPINDRHGHQMGSHCISEAGRIIKACLPPGGAGARFGGDEFVVWLAGVTLEEALELAEDVRARIEDFDFGRGELDVRPTVSVGVAALGPAVSGPEHLLRRADDALYRAKQAGRNRVSR